VTLVVDRWRGGRRREAAAIAGVFTVAVAPWAVWLLSVRTGTQVALFRPAGLLGLVPGQAAFYLARIPDALTGPFVELGTVYRPALRGPALAWAAGVCAVCGAGLVAAVRRPAFRLGATVLGVSLAVLLVWPFQEAGRFLIPLVPLLLVAAWVGLGGLLRKVCGAREAEVAAAGVLLLVALPYGLYVLGPRKPGAEHAAAELRAAGRWLAEAPREGPVLARQAGELYWLMDRRRTVAGVPEGAGAGEVAALAERFDPAYLLDDAGRYTGAAEGGVAAFVSEHPGSVREVFRAGSIVVYEHGGGGSSR
jgi:hypothetical protein